MKSNTSECLQWNQNVTLGIKRSITVVAAVLVAAVAFWVWQFTRRHAIPIPDEKVAAMTLLAEKLSGPRYFNAPATVIQNADGAWIGLEEVQRQKDRVADERQFDGGQRAQLERLIADLSEPQPARMVGGCRIQLERMNLALDAIK
jgi:hypothetical protein